MGHEGSNQPKWKAVMFAKCQNAETVLDGQEPNSFDSGQIIVWYDIS